MANSRSNIYPVQLQGAELNLNKFNAEIKQYSGFNKNNSPFVGGCLSNLFTKTEENTTGSSDSVYVDDNGDVYEAKTDGLYKNGEKVIDNTINKFINVYEESFPGDVIAYFSYSNHKEVFYYSVPSEYGNVTDIRRCKRDIITKEVIIDDVCHTVEHRESEGYMYVKTYIYNYQDTKYEAFKDIYYNSLTGKYLVTITVYIRNASWSDVVIADYQNSYVVDESDFIDAPLWGYVYDDPKLVIIPNIIGINEAIFYYGSSFHTAVPTIVNNLSSDYTLASSNIGDYVFLGYYAYLIKATNFVINNTAKKVPLRMSVYTDALGASDVRVYIRNSDFSSTQGLQYSSSTTVNFSLGTLDGKYLFKCDDSYETVFYGLKTSDNKNFWGICGRKVTANITLREDANGNKQPILEMGCIASYYSNILANNGYITGLATKQDILVTEWNSLNKDYLFIYRTDGADYAVLFRDETTKKYFKLEYGNKIILKYINGLLVTNYDTPQNCYRISDGAVLTFAPGWNNRALTGNFFTFTSAVTDNDYYMASSINEYNLKDNASILLNPVPVVTDALFVINGVKISQAKTDLSTYTEKDENVINFYSGADSEILYKGSVNLSGEYLYFNSELKGLPFPINTSGNVQLSPSLFCETERFGNDVFIKEGSNAYQLIKDGAESVMSYYLGTLIENLEEIFILQGQYYAIINKQIFNVQFSGGVVQSLSFVVSVENLQFCGNSAYQAYFFSKTNRCIYVFTGANILNQLQLVDKISEIYAYKYNQSTQSIILITDIGTIVSSNLGMYLIEGFTPDDVFFYDKGVVFVSDSELTYLQYYEADGFEKHNIEVETCFYGMNNETVTINDCLYFRLFSEEHEEGEVKVSATTISLKGRKTETTVFKFKASDWDALTHSVYVRYQPKEQRGLGISFSINSPFKIASMSIGSKADAILIDRVSKGAINAPEITSNNIEW